MFTKNIQKPRVSTSCFAVFIRFKLISHIYSHFTLCYTLRQCYTKIYYDIFLFCSHRFFQKRKPKPARIPPRVTDIFLLENSATPPRSPLLAPALRSYASHSPPRGRVRRPASFVPEK